MQQKPLITSERTSQSGGAGACRSQERSPDQSRDRRTPAETQPVQQMDQPSDLLAFGNRRSAAYGHLPRTMRGSGVGLDHDPAQGGKGRGAAERFPDGNNPFR